MDNKVSIIVPCYNSEATIKKCISLIQHSLQNYNDSLDYKLIVVNDGSQDGTADILETINEIIVVTHEKNRGLVCARNSGIKEQNSDYLVFIDSDVLILPDWFSVMFQYLKQNPSVVGVTGNLSGHGNNPSLLDRYLSSSYRGAKNINDNQPLLYKWFVFSNTIIRSSILQLIGRFKKSKKSY